MAKKTVVASALLGAVVVLGAGLLGPARYEGMRWRPQEAENTAVPHPSPAPGPTGIGTPHALPPPATTWNIDIVLIGWIAASLAVVVIGILLWRWLKNRKSYGLPDGAAVGPDVTGSDDAADSPEVSVPVLQRGLQHALSILSEERDPHDAIVRAWLGLQEAAEDSGVRRQAAETPTEFTVRILDRFKTDDRAVKTLLDLYLAARFGDHLASASDVKNAELAVTSLAATWQHDDTQADATGHPAGPHKSGQFESGRYDGR